MQEGSAWQHDQAVDTAYSIEKPQTNPVAALKVLGHVATESETRRLIGVWQRTVTVSVPSPGDWQDLGVRLTVVGRLAPGSGPHQAFGPYHLAADSRVPVDRPQE